MTGTQLELGDFDAVVFDMDGTLLDTEAVFQTVVSDVAREMGVEFSEALHLSIVGVSPEQTRLAVLAALGAEFPYDDFHLRCTTLGRTRMDEAVPVKAGAAELIAALRREGVPLAVATSSRRPYALQRLEQAGFLSHLETVVSRDDVVHAKPHPEPYLTAAARLRVDPRACLAFEDSYAGIRAAHAAGMRTIMVPDLLHPTEDIAALCHAVLDSLHHAHDHVFARSPAEASS